MRIGDEKEERSGGVSMELGSTKMAAGGGGGGGGGGLEEKGSSSSSSIFEGVMRAVRSPKNPINQINNRIKEVDDGYKVWLSKQPILVEAAAVTATSALQGAVIGYFLGILTKDIFPFLPSSSASPLNPKPPPPSLKHSQALSGLPLTQARNFAVMSGVQSGLGSIFRRSRGKEDMQSSIIVGFGTGSLFSLVSQEKPCHIPNVVTTGLIFSFLHGLYFKIGRRNKEEDDERYSKVRCMLTDLGLQYYENRFKRGLLMDTTLPLLTDSALRDARILPGPRLLILDYIKRAYGGDSC